MPNRGVNGGAACVVVRGAEAPAYRLPDRTVVHFRRMGETIAPHWS